MQEITSSDKKLCWIHPDPAQRYFELVADSEPVAKLQLQQGIVALAHAEAAEGRWTFKQVGFLHPHVTVRQQGADVNVAKFEPNASGGGALHFPDGRSFRWVSNFWLSEWSWTDVADNRVMSFRRDFAIDKREGELTLRLDAKEIPHLSILALLGWYLIIMLADEAAMTNLT
ncbi:MAG: hypothetical protein WBX15_03810 [Thermoanaerobaculia bacterium]